MQLLWISLGGALGTCFRFLLVQTFSKLTGPNTAYSILLVNLIGSFLISFLAASFFSEPGVGQTTKLVLTAGFLGGFTTYASFNFELLVFLQQGLWVKGITYFVAMTFSCLFAGLLGYFLATKLVV